MVSGPVFFGKDIGQVFIAWDVMNGHLFILDGFADSIFVNLEVT